MITHDTPTSSNIARLKYNPDNAELHIEFRNGKTYKYADVDMETWNKFVDAQSAGKFFHSDIKTKFQQA